MMTENLSDMVKNGPTEKPIIFSEQDLQIPDVSPMETAQEQSEENDPNIIKITKLSNWFDGNVDNFPQIRKPTINITNVDLNEQLLITVPSGDSATSDKRKIIVFDDAHIIPVLNRSAVDMQVYGNGFRIIYDLGEGIFVKSYGVRKGLVSVFCNDIDDILIPYGIIRVKKKDENIEIIRRDPSEITSQLNDPVDIEALQLRYKQSSKAEDLHTNLDAIKWLIERQGSIEDVNHHLQIDNVIIETLA